MNYLYLLLDIGSLSLPFIFSFHPKLKFYKKWKALFLSIFIMMLVFIPWDIIFTKNGIWGFNETYFSGIYVSNLPIEEWLFFICIPYACVFTHYSLIYFFPKMALEDKNVTLITHIFIAVLLLISVIYYDKWYTFINSIYAIILLVLVELLRSEILKTFYLTFLVILIPFFIVNGVLTGSFIEESIVWYNNDENLGIRLGTIPIEDAVYAFTMLLTVLVLTDYFDKKWTKVTSHPK